MPKAISILGFYVNDIATTKDFYTKLGFTKTREGGATVEFVLGDMRLQFTDKEASREQGEKFMKEAFAEEKGLGLYINVEVDDVDAYYKSLKDKGVTPSTEPKDWPWGHREFVIRDPDRYKLVIYQKI